MAGAQGGLSVQPADGVKVTSKKEAPPAEVVIRDDKGQWIVPPRRGRPPGSRNKLAETFLFDLLADWQAHGPQAIATIRDKEPVRYVQIVAAILPKNVNIEVNELDGFTEDQLKREVVGAIAELAALGIDLFPEAGAAEATEQTLDLQPLSEAARIP